MAGSKKTTKAKDLAPKKAVAVKGGGTPRPQHNLTLVRAAKPAVKRDLPPKKSPKGGYKIRPNENLTLVRGAKPAVKKDLSPKKSGGVKGGKVRPNDNFTLVRGAKPAVKKDLSPKKSPKGGKKKSG